MNKRITTCLKVIERQKLDALLISNPVNVTYLTGFRHADGYLLVYHDECVYFTNPLFYDEAKALKGWKVICASRNIFDKVISYASRKKLRKVGFEGKHLSYLEVKTFKTCGEKKKVSLEETVDIVEDIRTIKSPQETSYIRKAHRISQETFEFAREIFTPSMTEKDLALELERFLKIKGDSEIPFPPIIAFGRNTSFPHHLPEETPLIHNKFILIDLGARSYGYAADLTRVFFLGKMPIRLRRIIDIVKKAQELAIKKIKDGVKAKDVDAAARDYIAKKGYGKNFLHGLGHGVGLCVHEKPYLNPVNNSTLKEGMVVTIEPAIYLHNRIGVRIEDMVLVRKNRGEVL